MSGAARRARRWTADLAWPLVALLLAAGWPLGGARGQEEAAAGEPASEESGGEAAEASQGDREAIEEIFAGEEEALSGQGPTYDPGGRRDPFQPLVQPRRTGRGGRPADQKPCQGVACEYIESLTLTGIFLTGGGAVAQVRSAGQKQTFLLRVGDELADGDVARITATEVVFRQDVEEAGSLKPFREVVKKLNL